MNGAPDIMVTRAFARAGLLGNPSDGFHGKTISFAIADYWAEARFEPSDQLELVLPGTLRFESLAALREQVTQQGYYGAERLLKATLKRFGEFAEAAGPLENDGRNFRLSVSSRIPRQVGMAGSSALVTAMLRGLGQWYGVDLPPHLLASLTLSVERELGIPAGLQDRVIQAYQGAVFMDFSESMMKEAAGLQYGHYEPIPLSELEAMPLYIAYARNAGQPTEVLHNRLRERFDAGDTEVRAAMQRFAELAEQGREALAAGDVARLGQLIDANFDQRAAICELHPQHAAMVQAARSAGASAKFCGSGGAIVGLCDDGHDWNRVVQNLCSLDCQVFRPTIAASISDGTEGP